VATKKIAMLGKTQYLQGVKRFQIFTDKKFPLKTIYQFGGRFSFQKNTIEQMSNLGMIPYAWYIFEKGYKGKTNIEFIEPFSI